MSKCRMDLGDGQLTEVDFVSPAVLRRTMLERMTLTPVQSKTLMLTWMQTFPDQWGGYHPEQCVPIARREGAAQDA